MIINQIKSNIKTGCHYTFGIRTGLIKIEKRIADANTSPKALNWLVELFNVDILSLKKVAPNNKA